MVGPLRPPATREWVGSGSGSKLLGTGVTALQRLAMLGEIKWQVTPDGRTLYEVKSIKEAKVRLDRKPVGV